MALIPGFSLGGHATHVIQQFTDSQSRARARVIAAGGSEEAAGNCLRGRYNELRNRVIERTDTNYIRNSVMSGATGSVLPLNWESVIPSGLTSTISASGVASGYTYVDFKINGTATTDGTLSLWFEKNASLPSTSQATLTDVWVGSAFLNLASGAVSGIPDISLQLAGVNNAGVVQESFSSSLVGLPSGGFNRFEQTGTIANANTTFTNLRITHTVVNGTLYNYIIRIAAPQLEKGTFFAGGYKASPFILTPGNAIASRITGRPSILVVPQLTRQSGTNLCLQSEAFNVSGTWVPVLGGTGSNPAVTANAVISPDGTQNAETVVFNRGANNTISDQSTLQQTITLAVSGTYTFSVYAKATTSGDVGKQIFLRAGGAGSLIAYTLTSSWVRLSRIETSLASGINIFQIGNRGTFTADNSVSVDLWGAQVEVGSTATPYIPTTTGSVFRDGTVFPQLPTVSGADFTFTRATTATRVNASGLIESVASGLLRLDYPVTGGCPAALIEPSAQNLVLQSEAWNVSPWAATSGSQGATVSGNVTASPDGTTNADKLIESAVTGNHFCLQTLTLTSGTTYTASCFVKASERTRGRLRTSGASAYWDLDFNLTSGTVTGGTNPFIQNYGNGWYRIGATFTANQASNNFILFLLDASGNVSYTGDGTSGIFVWGAQIETGAIPTSYIPTTNASATRNADVCSVSGVSGYIGQTEGVLYAEVDMQRLQQTTIFTIDVGGTSEFISILKFATGSFRVFIKKSSSSQVNILSSAANPVGIYKIAVGYKNGDYALYVNGSQAATSNNSTDYPTGALSRALLSDTTYGVFNDRIRAYALYTTRLDNTTLANITRLT